MFGGPIFEGRNEILLLDKALKSGNFSKICIKIIKKFGKIFEKIPEKGNFVRNFLIFGLDYGKNKEYNMARL